MRSAVGGHSHVAMIKGGGLGGEKEVWVGSADLGGFTFT